MIGKMLKKYAVSILVFSLLASTMGCANKVAQNDYLDTDAGYDKELFYQNLGTIQAEGI